MSYDTAPTTKNAPTTATAVQSMREKTILRNVLERGDKGVGMWLT